MCVLFSMRGVDGEGGDWKFCCCWCWLVTVLPNFYWPRSAASPKPGLNYRWGPKESLQSRIISFEATKLLARRQSAPGGTAASKFRRWQPPTLQTVRHPMWTSPSPRGQATPPLSSPGSRVSPVGSGRTSLSATTLRHSLTRRIPSRRSRPGNCGQTRSKAALPQPTRTSSITPGSRQCSLEVRT